MSTPSPSGARADGYRPGPDTPYPLDAPKDPFAERNRRRAAERQVRTVKYLLVLVAVILAVIFSIGFFT